MGLSRKLRAIASIFTFGAVIYDVKTRQSHGTYLGVPFEFRVPTRRRFKERLWNPDDSRVFTPHLFGVGWSLNAYQLARRLRLLDNRNADQDEPSAEG